MTTIQMIDGFRRFDKVSKEKLCDLSGISLSTYNRRLANPDDLTFGECRALCHGLRVAGERKTQIERTLLAAD